MGDTKGGPFDIPGSLANQMLQSPNPHGKGNSEVVKPWINGRDITDRSRGMWIIDFGDMSADEAALFEAPFEYVNACVRPKGKYPVQQYLVGGSMSVLGLKCEMLSGKSPELCDSPRIQA